MYVFAYALQLLVSLLLVVVLTFVDYSRVPAWLQKGLHGVFWPGHEWVSSRVVPRDVLKATEIISFDILGHLAVFVTFGISSPYLALILIFSVCLKLYMWRVIIGRFVYIRSSPSRDLACSMGGQQESGDVGLSMLNLACLPILDMLERGMWAILLSSAVFFGFICWDMAGDKVDWKGSIWAPLTVLSIPLLLWCCVVLFRYHRVDASSDNKGQQSDTGATLRQGVTWSSAAGAAAVNPMQRASNIEMRVE